MRTAAREVGGLSVQVRDSVRAVIAGKDRPGIVIEVEPDLVRVAYGTRAEHPWPSVAVSPDSRTGRSLGLTEETHFYGANVEWLARSAVTLVGRQVPRDLLEAVAVAVSRYEATLD